MGDVYQLDKIYGTWVRQHVTSASKKYTIKMVEFRLYIELRDLQKSKRFQKSSIHPQVLPPYPKGKFTATKAKAKAVPSARTGIRRTLVQSEWEEVMGAESSETKMEMFSIFDEIMEDICELFSILHIIAYAIKKGVRYEEARG